MHLPSILLSTFLATTQASPYSSNPIPTPKPGILLPTSPGKYHIGKTQHILPHTTFDDPVAPAGSNRTTHFLLLSIFYPTLQRPTQNSRSTYMDVELARLFEIGYALPNNTLQRLQTDIQPSAPTLRGREAAKLQSRPTVLYSTGAGGACVGGTAGIMDLVVDGWTVICADHPGEMPFLALPRDVEVPGPAPDDTPAGRGVHGVPVDFNWLDARVLYAANRMRKADVEAVVAAFPGLVRELGAPFNASAYLHYGFSLGGTVGSHLVGRHDGVLAGLNFDGPLLDAYFGEAEDVGAPFLLVHEDGVVRGDPLGDPKTFDVNFSEFIGNQTGWWEYFVIRGTAHVDFSDAPLWFELLDLGNSTKLQLGSIGGSRMREVMTGFTKSWFQFVVGGGREGVLGEDVPSAAWEEVVFMGNSSFW